MSALESRGRGRDGESVEAEEEAVEEASREIFPFRLELRRELWALEFGRECRRELRRECCLGERDRRGLSVDLAGEWYLVCDVLGASLERFLRVSFFFPRVSGDRVGCFR